MTKPPPTKGERLVHDVAVYYANKNDSPTAAAGYMPAHKALLEYIAELERAIVITTNEQGDCVAVTRQDDEGRILDVLWEKK